MPFLTQVRRITLTLVAAAKAVGFVDAMNGEGNFIVLAPTDKAILAEPEHTGESLLKPRNKYQWVAVLTFHMVPGKIMSTDIAGQSTEVESARAQCFLWMRSMVCAWTTPMLSMLILRRITE